MWRIVREGGVKGGRTEKGGGRKGGGEGGAAAPQVSVVLHSNARSYTHPTSPQSAYQLKRSTLCRCCWGRDGWAPPARSCLTCRPRAGSRSLCSWQGVLSGCACCNSVNTLGLPESRPPNFPLDSKEGESRGSGGRGAGKGKGVKALTAGGPCYSQSRLVGREGEWV